MNRSLHKTIRRASSIAEERGLSMKDVCAEAEIPYRTFRRWNSREVRPESEYDNSYKDEDRRGRLLKWVEEKEPTQEETDFKQEAPQTPHITGHKAGYEDQPTDEIIEQQRNLYKRKKQKEQAKDNQVVNFSHGPIALVFQGDEHYGASGCDVDHALKDAHTIADTPGMYAIKMGDLVDNFVVEYLKGKNATPSLAVEKQWEVAKRHLEILSGHTIAVVGGNHDATWNRNLVHLDPVKQLTDDGVLYDPNCVEFTLRIGRTEKDVFVRHRISKWGSQWNETHSLEKAAKFAHPGRDIYASAHEHNGLHLKLFAKRGGGYAAAVQVDTYKKFDDYGDEKGYSDYDKEHVAGTVIIEEDGTMTTMLDLDAASRHMKRIYNS